MKIRQILKIIAAINRLEYLEYSLVDGHNNWSGWDGTLSLEGIKRMIYGIWHDGYNELGQNMLTGSAIYSIQLYHTLIELCKDTPEIEVHIAGSYSPPHNTSIN